MSKFGKSLIAASVAAATLGSSVAMAELSANIGATSNYIWRGVTQSNDNSAISGGVDYAHDSGVYLGTWMSTVDFTDETSDKVEYEHDIYLGFGGEAGDFGYDLGVARYMYPLSDDADFTEVYASGTYSFFTAGLAYTAASDVVDTDAGETAESDAQMFLEGDLYYYVSGEFELPQDFGLGVTVGRYTFDDDGVENTDLDYNHYQLALSKSAGDMGDFTLAYDQNDLDGVTNGKDNDDPRFSVSWSKSF